MTPRPVPGVDADARPAGRLGSEGLRAGQKNAVMGNGGFSHYYAPPRASLACFQLAWAAALGCSPRAAERPSDILGTPAERPRNALDAPCLAWRNAYLLAVSARCLLVSCLSPAPSRRAGARWGGRARAGVCWAGLRPTAPGGAAPCHLSASAAPRPRRPGRVRLKPRSAGEAASPPPSSL